MTRFRPCIDLHAGSVKQIVGGTLSTTTPDVLKTNWTSEHPSAYYAALYKQNGLSGAHVIMLGPGNDDATKEALGAWEAGMQVGGGITERNARDWIDRGAEKVSADQSLFASANRRLMRRAVGHHHIVSVSGLHLLHGPPEGRPTGPGRRQDKARHRLELSKERRQMVCCY
jgi:phosphoribosylformimino-5-aminoimidazole carboxamide ribonucleotide (ProFAR) isomerase